MTYYFIILIVSCIALIFVCAFDTLKGIIPNTLSLLLFALGIASLFLDKGINNIAMPISFAVGIFAFQMVLFAINEDSIGGGDIKILTSCTLFMHSLESILAFFIAYTIMTIFLSLVYKLDDKKEIRIGGAFGIAFSTAMLFSYERLEVFGINASNYPFLIMMIITSTAFIVFYSINNNKEMKGKLTNYVKETSN